MSMGGQVYDVSQHIAEREMLQHMASLAGGTSFALALWRTAYDEDEGENVEEDSQNLIDGLKTGEKEYVASWASHLRATYPLVGVINPRKSRVRKRKSDEENSTKKIHVASVTKRSRTKDITEVSSSSTASTSSAAAVISSTASEECKEWVVMRFHLTLGTLRPCVLPLRVRVLEQHQHWWKRREEQNLQELSLGIHANSDGLFDDISAATGYAAEGATVPLTTLSYRYKLHLSKDAESFDGKSAMLTLDHDTGNVVPNMMLPCIMTCDVEPLE